MFGLPLIIIIINFRDDLHVALALLELTVKTFRNSLFMCVLPVPMEVWWGH